MVLEDGIQITGGTLATGPGGTLAVETSGGAALHDVDVINGYSIEVFAGSVLILDQLTTVANTGATMTIDGTGTLKMNDASITGGPINDYSMVTGRIIAGDTDITGSSAISDASINRGEVMIESGQTLTLDNDVVTGTRFIDTADGATIQVDGGHTLTLNGVRIDGGAIDDYGLVSGSIIAGDIDVTGSSLIVNADINYGDVTIAAGQTLTLFGGIITGASLNDTADGAILQVDADTALTLNDVSITGGTINDHGLNQFGVDAAGYVDVDGSSIISDASLNDGNLTIQNHSTLMLDNDTVTGTVFDTLNGSAIQIDGGTTLTLDGVSITGGTINDYSVVTGRVIAGDIDITGSSSISDASLNHGEVTIESGQTLTLDDDIVTGTWFVDTADGATIQVDAGQTLTLNGVRIDGGTINSYSLVSGFIISGDIYVSGSSLIVNADINYGIVTIDAGQTLTLFGGTITGAFFDDSASGSILQVDADTGLILNGASITGGTIDDHGLNQFGVDAGSYIYVDGSSTFRDVSLNDGTVTIQNHSTLALDNDTVTGTVFDTLNGSAIQIDGGTTLTLDGVTTTGGAINIADASGSIVAGDIDIIGSSKISYASINHGEVTIESGQTLTLDDDIFTGTRIINTGATIQIDGIQMLTLNGAEIDGGTINNYSLYYINNTPYIGGAVIDVTGSSLIVDADINYGIVAIEAGQTLTLDGGATITGAFVGPDGSDVGVVLQIEGGTTLTLDDTTITGGTINNHGPDQFGVDAGSYIDVDGSSTIRFLSLNDGTVTTQNDSTLTLDNVTVTGTVFDTLSGSAILIEDNYKLTLDGASITGGAINLDDATSLYAAGDIDITGSSTIADASVNQGDVTIEANQTLTLDNDTVTGTSFADTADGAIIQIDGGTTLKLDGVSITGGTINDYSLVSGNIVAGNIDITGSSTISNAILNKGDATIEDGQTLTLDHVTVNDTTITFAGSGTLAIDQPSTFYGEIAGISGSGDVLELGGFDAAHDIVVASTGSGSYNSATNTTSLIVTDETTHHSVTLNLVGDYASSNWAATADGHGGVDVAGSGGNGGPVFSSMTLTVGEGGTTVLTNSDFSVSEPGVTNFTYSVQNITGGQFEVFNGSTWTAAPTGGFTTAQIAAGDVEFVQDGTATTPGFSISASDGTHVSTAITPTVHFATAPAVTIDTAAPTSTTIDVPGTTSTEPHYINNSGQIVGQDDSSGWEFSGGSFSTIAYLDAFQTFTGGINDAGVIVGSYLGVDSSENPVSANFSLTDGVYTTIVLPSLGTAVDMTAVDINDSDVLIGDAFMNGRTVGFVDAHGSMTALFDPNAVSSTVAVSINNLGDVAGYFDGMHGFLYHDGTYTTIDDPNAVDGTYVEGVNDYGQVVGFYLDANGESHGFVESGGVYTTIDNPLGAQGTNLYGINNSDQIVGSYFDANGDEHGFETSFNATSTAENTPLVLTSISVADAAAGANPIEVSLAVKDGVLALNDTTGLGISFDTKHDTVTLTGSVAAIDAALARGVVYTPNSGFTGDDTLTIVANDQGHTAAGIAQSNTQTLNIPVTAPVVPLVASDLSAAINGNSSGYSGSLIANDSAPNGDAFTVSGAMFNGTAAIFNQADGAYEMHGAEGELFIYPEAVSNVTVGGFVDASFNAGDFVFVPDSDPNNIIHHLAPGATDGDVFTYTITDSVTGVSSTALVDLTFADSDIFSGADSTSWTVGNNWMFGVPASGSIAYIGSSTQVDASGAVIDNVTVDTADNTSTIAISGGATLTLHDATINGGTIDDFSTTASSQIIAGDIDVTASSTITNASLNHGNVTIENGQALKLDAVTVNDTTITFAGSSGTLEIDQPSTFSGKIAGISGGSDVLDLGGFDAAHDSVVASTGSGSYDSATNTTSLLVTDETTHQSTTLTLAGNYSGSTWAVKGDGHGGADIVDPPVPSSAGSGSGMQPPAATNGQGFVFNFAGLPSSDAHLNDSASLTRAASTLNEINDEHSGSVFVTPDGHDVFTAQAIVKAQLHAGDFHFV